MSTAYEIPITPSVPQTFTISLGGTFFNLTVRWSTSMAAWFLDLADAANNFLLNGVPLVTGADILAQYAYLGIGGQLVVQSDNDLSLVPDFDTLGDTGHFYFIATPGSVIGAANTTPANALLTGGGSPILVNP